MRVLPRICGRIALEWIIELDEIDPNGAAFRYADEEAGKALGDAEYCVNFVQFKFG